MFSIDVLQTWGSLLVFDICASLLMLSADTWSRVLGLIASNSGRKLWAWDFINWFRG